MGKAGKSVSKKNTGAAKTAASDEESARGRLLSAATHLFCKNGINATGIAETPEQLIRIDLAAIDRSCELRQFLPRDGGNLIGDRWLRPIGNFQTRYR